MPRKIQPLYVGFFVIAGLTISVALVLWVGFFRFFEKHKTYVTYFDESVKGLQEDAIVNYRGVPIGRVGRVSIAPDGRLVEVLLFLKPDFPVDDTLVVRLREQGITGLRFLEIDKAPEDVNLLTPKISFKPPYPLIRSYPSEITAIKLAAERLYSKLIDLDLKSFLSELQKTTIDLREFATNKHLMGSLVLFEENLRNLKKITGEFSQIASDHKLWEIVAGIEDTTEAFREVARSLDVSAWNTTMAELRQNLVALNQTVNDLNVEMLVTFRKMREVLDEFRLTLGEIGKSPGRIFIRHKPYEPFDEEVGR